MSSLAVAYLDGRWKPQTEAAVSIDDRGFLFGDCLYDVISAHGGLIFRLDDHLERFFASMRAACINSPLSRSEWRDRIVECVRRNKLQDASIRLMITRGVPKPAPRGSRDYVDLASFVPDFQPTVIITASPYYYLAEREARERGVRLWISHVRALPADTLDPRYKSQSRLHFQLARIEALAAGRDDAILVDASGNVSEGPASNVFLVSAGALYTSRAQILRGITRMTVLELAERLDVAAHERDITTYDLYSADEVFTTSTGGGLLAVSEVGGRPCPRPVPGPVTRLIDAEYWRMRAAGEYSTPVYESTEALPPTRKSAPNRSSKRVTAA